MQVHCEVLPLSLPVLLLLLLLLPPLCGYCYACSAPTVAVTACNAGRVLPLQDDKRTDPKVLRHLELENAYMRQQTKHLEGFTAHLYVVVVHHSVMMILECGEA